MLSMARKYRSVHERFPRTMKKILARPCRVREYYQPSAEDLREWRELQDITFDISSELEAAEVERVLKAIALQVQQCAEEQQLLHAQHADLRARMDEEDRRIEERDIMMRTGLWPLMREYMLDVEARVLQELVEPEVARSKQLFKEESLQDLPLISADSGYKGVDYFVHFAELVTSRHETRIEQLDREVQESLDACDAFVNEENIRDDPEVARAYTFFHSYHSAVRPLLVK